MIGADREFVRRLSKFLVVGASGVVVNNVTLFTLYQFLRFPLVLASGAAAVVAIGNNFLWNDRWTFAQQHTAMSAAIRRFARFGVASLGGLVLTTLTLWLLVNEFGLHYLIANLVAISAGTASNFLINSRWTYGKATTA
jgi:dolichol-phosphate mannosyltransferase